MRTRAVPHPNTGLIYNPQTEVQMRTLIPPVLRPAACLLALAIAPAWGQQGARNGEWPTYGGDLGNSRYSALDQINAGNFNQLELAWRFKTDNLGPRTENNLEGTPLMVRGVIYATAGTRRSVVALNATLGLRTAPNDDRVERGTVPGDSGITATRNAIQPRRRPQKIIYGQTPPIHQTGRAQRRHSRS
jgi:hypothetical protein